MEVFGTCKTPALATGLDSATAEDRPRNALC